MLHGTLLLSYIGEIHYAFELWNKLQTFDLESLFLNLVIHIKWCTFFIWLTFHWWQLKWKLNHERFTNGISTGDHIEDFGAGFVCLKVAANIAVFIILFSTYLLIHWSKDWMKLIFKSSNIF